MPELKLPEKPKDKAGRHFEIRTYESHSIIKGTLKVEMFNKAEIDIFKKVGLDAVFYGEAKVAKNLPQLTYMLVYDSGAARKKAWKAFKTDPDWEKLKGIEQEVAKKAWELGGDGFKDLSLSGKAPKKKSKKSQQLADSRQRLPLQRLPPRRKRSLPRVPLPVRGRAGHRPLHPGQRERGSGCRAGTHDQAPQARRLHGQPDRQQILRTHRRHRPAPCRAQEIDPESAADTASFSMDSDTYIYQSGYGSPVVDKTSPTIAKSTVSPDRKSVRLKIDGLVKGNVHELKLPGVRNSGGQALLHPVGYYTPNEIPNK